MYFNSSKESRNILIFKILNQNVYILLKLCVLTQHQFSFSGKLNQISF
jgi:hypothetical protein